MRQFMRLALIAGAALSGGTAAAELPTFEIIGFPLTQHQAAVLGNTANMKERTPTPSLTLGEMPASPVQIGALTPRRERELAKE
jgi:hypothetical protein